MVYLKFVVENDDGEIIYDFMPESPHAKPGSVSVNRITHERKLIRKSPDSPLSMYHAHAWKRVDQMIVDNNLKQETYAAWY